MGVWVSVRTKFVASVVVLFLEALSAGHSAHAQSMSQMCKNFSANGARECTTAPTLISDWSYSIPSCAGIRSTGELGSEDAAISKCVEIISTQPGINLCRGVSSQQYSDWWIDDPIRYSRFNYKTVTRQEGKSVKFSWGVIDSQGTCQNREWDTGGPSNHYSPLWRSRLVTCQSPWNPYDDVDTAFCARPVDCPWGCSGFGNAIYPASGVKKQNEIDYAAGGLTFGRHYNSAGYQRQTEFEVRQAIAGFGHFWRHSYFRQLWTVRDASAPGGVGAAWLQRPDLTSYFTSTRVVSAGGVVFLPRGEQRDRLEAQLDTNGNLVQWRYRSADNTVERYSPAGVVQAIFLANGQAITFDHPQSGGLSISGPFGRELRLTQDALGRHWRLALPDGTEVGYEYSYPVSQDPLLFSSNLTGVVFPDGSRRSYVYGEGSQVNSFGAAQGNFDHALTGIRDELDVRYANFGYSLPGASSTEYAHGVNRYAWNSSRQQITDPLGMTRWIQYSPIAGMMLESRDYAEIPFAGGTQVVERLKTFDTNGGLLSYIDAGKRMTCYANDLSRNLTLSTVSGLDRTVNCAMVMPANAGLPLGSRKTSTEWHPDWRFETRVAKPGRIITSVYNGLADPFAGGAIASCAPASAVLPDGKPIAVLCKRVEQATTDANGAAGFAAALQTGVPARTTSWTYNQWGQVLAENGPRTDVNDTTTYSYYSDTSFTGEGAAAQGHFMGDLATVTNAAGKVTQYTKYNKHGQVLESIDPNNVLTVNTYDLRQRLLSSTVGGQATSYSYDPVGQLKKVTLPDQSWVGYDYDDAHRQVAVYDHKGNRTDYTLDNAGNRTGETTKDPSGALKRQLSRSIDALGRVQQTVGIK